MAGQLTQGWNLSIWGPVARILAEPTEFALMQPRPPRPVRQIQRRLPDEFWDKVIAEYQAGASATSLEKRYDVDDETIRRRLRSRAITPRPQREPTFVGARLEQAQAMRAQGATYAEIGNHFGVTRYAASLALNKADAGSVDAQRPL